MNKQKFISKVRIVGGSKMARIPKDIVELENIQEDKMYEFTIQDCESIPEILSYRCNICLHRFDSDECNPYCPACGNESVKEVRE